MNTVQVLLSIVVDLDWLLHQFNVKNAFFNGDLKEEAYKNSFLCIEEKFGSKVCKLKALYKLKQSPRP